MKLLLLLVVVAASDHTVTPSRYSENKCVYANMENCIQLCAGSFMPTVKKLGYEEKKGLTIIMNTCLDRCEQKCVDGTLTGQRRRIQEQVETEPSRSQCLATQVVSNHETITDCCDRVDLLEKRVVEIEALLESGNVSMGENDQFKVLSIEHANGSVGTYFHFDVGKVTEILGRDNWGSDRFKLTNKRSGYSGWVILWNTANGGSVGDAHGRYDLDPIGNGETNWQTGDILVFDDYALLQGLGDDSFYIQSVNHSNGSTGVYFNYHNSEVDKMLGRTDWSSERFQMRNHRTEYSGWVVLWRSPNGGSEGDGHGRWDGDPIGNPDNYFFDGDIMTFVNLPAARRDFVEDGLRVLGIEHNGGTTGMYFSFNNDEASAALGKSPDQWEAEVHKMKISRTGYEGTLVIWKNKMHDDDKGTGHGRFDNDPIGNPAGYFKVGDVMYFLDL